MAKYGMPYMGSKADIADAIIDFLPPGDRFVDLFGGGGAMTHCASRKYKRLFYNEFNPEVVELFRRACAGEFNYNRFKPAWISRQDFQELKDKDPYVKYVWSFGNSGNAYLYGKDIEEIKRNGHNFVIFGDPAGRVFLKEHYKDSMYWLIDNIYVPDNPAQSRANYANVIIKIEAIKVCRDYGDINVFNEFKDLDWVHFRAMSNKAIVDAINKYCPDIPKKQYKNNKFDELKQLQQLQQLQQLEQLQRLERLQQLEQLERLEIHCGDYRDYVHQDGDVVYCDPPYENTAKYTTGEFDHKAFYDWVASRPYQVFFSSYEISDNRFFVVKEMSRRCKLSQKNTDGQTERLYSNRPYKELSLF